MKRMYKAILLYSLAGIIPFSLAFSQEKKNEQKIKVVINDGSGEKTVLDTTYVKGTVPHIMILKDGKVLHIGDPSEGISLTTSEDGNKKVYVTVTAEGEGKKEIEKDVIIMKSDSMIISDKPGEKHVMTYAITGSKGEGKVGTIIIKSAGDKDPVWVSDETGVNKVVVIRDGKVTEHMCGDVYTVKVSDDNEPAGDVTRYVVAKDGLVITVEGKDEVRAKEIIKVIESKLGVKEEGKVNPEVIKKETIKSVKK